MKRRSKSAALLAAAVTVVLAASACGGPVEENGGDSPGADAAVKGIVNKSDKKGGTLVLEESDIPDSFDPGNTYYGFVFNFSRLYARPLTTFPPKPGDESTKVVPDLAESLGKPSDDGKTWTYKLREGLTYEDGTPITSKDVKYAIERSNYAREVHSNGPAYFAQYLKDNEEPYKGPYKDKSEQGLESIETPDDRTIVFHLKQPFADFDYLVANPQTAPVPRDRDTGANYVKNIVSSGSYKFESYDQNRGAVLVRNENWDPKTDPLRKQLPDRIEVRFKVNAETIDNNLLSGKTHLNLAGTGVSAQTQSKLLREKSPDTDNATGGRLSYMAINTKVAPFDKVECRKAVQYAVDKSSVQGALGGKPRGDIASTLLPTDVPGYQDFDLYPTEGDKGDPAKAKQMLKECGKPNGFSTVLSARSDRKEEVDAATAIQAALKKVGIKVQIQQYPSGKYFTDYAGVPKFTEDKGIGLMMMQWGADWPTGFGYLQQVVHGDAINDSGNVNLSQLDDDKINKLLDDAISNVDEEARNRAYAEVDKRAMELAAVVPLTYFKVLHYRSPDITNVMTSQAWSGQYDYLNIGLK